MRPSTMASRREIWGNDARQFVLDIARAARGEGGQAWRIAYLAGAKTSELKGETLAIKLHRIRPHVPHVLKININRPDPTRAEIDAIAWHMDQDARIGDEDAPPLPAGSLLVDKLTACLLQRCGMGEHDLRALIESEVEDGKALDRRYTKISLRRGAGVAEMKVEFYMNEVRAAFELPGLGSARWKTGQLNVPFDQKPIPESLMLGMRGRTLRDVIDHQMFAEMQGVTVTAVSHAAGMLSISTNAATTGQLTAIPDVHRPIAA